MKKIDPNVASKLMEKETEAHALREKIESINEDFELLEAYVKVLHGYLSWQDNVNALDYDETCPFVDEFEKKIKQIGDKFDGLHDDLKNAGCLGSRLNLKDGIWRKVKIIIQEIPTTWKHEEKTEPAKKAA